MNMILCTADSICLAPDCPTGSGHISMEHGLQVLFYKTLPIFGAEYNVQKDFR
jgi:hypothetical protein